MLGIGGIEKVSHMDETVLLYIVRVAVLGSASHRGGEGCLNLLPPYTSHVVVYHAGKYAV